MNGPQQSGAKPSGQRFAQKLTSQEPVYDRKLKIHRPRKKKGGGPKWV